MAQIELYLPTAIKPSQGMSPGAVRPGLDVVNFKSGYSTSRDWSEQNLRIIDYPVELIGASTDGLRDFEAFLHNVKMRHGVFWLKEPISGTFYGMPCGPLGDGSSSLFAVPVYGSSAVVIMADGVPTAATSRGKANRFDDDKWCAPIDAGDFTIGGGNDELSSFSRFGAQSLLVTGAGGAPVTVAPFTITYNVSVTTGEDINVMFDVFDTVTRNFKITVYWNDGVPGDSTTSSGTMASTAGEWKIIEDTFTAPAGTNGAWVQLVDQTANTDPFYLDAVSVAPVTYDRIHLPSMAPDVYELTSAPAEGARVTANATGKRMIRGRLVKSDISWAETDPGHASPDSITMAEEVEV